MADWAVYINIAAVVLGTAFSVYGQMAQADAQSTMLKYNQQVAAAQAEYAQLAAAAQQKALEQQMSMIGAAAEADAGIAEQDAELARKAAEYEKQVLAQEGTVARNAAAVEIEKAAERLKRTQATSRSLIATSGVEPEGSPLLVLMEQAGQTQRDIDRLRYGVALSDRATELDIEAAGYEGELRARGNLIEAGRIRRSAAMESAQLRSEIDQIRFGADMTAFGFRSQGKLFDYQRRSIGAALPYQVGSTLLTGASSFASLYRRPAR